MEALTMYFESRYFWLVWSQQPEHSALVTPVLESSLLARRRRRPAHGAAPRFW